MSYCGVQICPDCRFASHTKLIESSALSKTASTCANPERAEEKTLKLKKELYFSMIPALSYNGR